MSYGATNTDCGVRVERTEDLGSTGLVPGPAAFAGAPTCKQPTHCGLCAANSISIFLKETEGSNGCCGEETCITEEKEFEEQVINPIASRADDGPDPIKCWSHAGYRLAFRYVHGIGQRGVQIKHSVCVLDCIRAYATRCAPAAVQKDPQTDQDHDDSQNQTTKKRRRQC